jgi:hypothetical protein
MDKPIEDRFRLQEDIEKCALKEVSKPGEEETKF